MSLVQFGTNIASIRKKTVAFYNRAGTSVTVYEGMPICYMFDTTTNILGINKATNVKGATTAESYQNEGKFLIVELPYTDNLLWFAGVVAAGPWCNKSVATLATKWLDIYEPNGAIVPVRVDIDTTASGRSILAIEDDSQALTALGTSSNYTTRPVAIAAEDVTGTSGTPVLSLAKLDPNLFICQDLSTSSALIVAPAGTGYSALNRINVTDAFTAGSFCAFEIKTTHTGGAEAAMGLGFMVKTVINTIGPTARSCAAGIQLRIDSGTIATEVSALRLYLRETAATWSMAGAYAVSVLGLTCQVTSSVTANKLYWLSFENDGAQTPDGLMYIKNMGELGDHTAGGSGPTDSANDRMIPIRFATSTYYLIAYEDDNAN